MRKSNGDSFARLLYKKHKSPLVGLRTTFHFWERYVERFDTDLKPIKDILTHINKNMCLILFDAACSEELKIAIRLDTTEFVVALLAPDSDVSYHRLQLRTLYRI